MKKLSFLPLILVLSLVILIQVGCGGDSGTGTPPPENCGITLREPAAGANYGSGDMVRIRWDEQGSAAQVDIELLKSGEMIGAIGTVANDGYQGWDAATFGRLTGDDYAIRVAAVGEPACADTTAMFTILNTVGCNYGITSDFDPDDDPQTQLSLMAGTTFDITWTSSNTTGFVDIELLRDDLPDDEPVGYLISGTQDDGSYQWTVDSLNQGTYGFFKLRVSDSDDGLSGTCFDMSPTFEIVDTDICEIWINVPQPATVWNVGDQVSIIFTAPSSSTTAVGISLYEGTQFVNTIAPQVNTTGLEQSVTWTVSTQGSQSPGNTYRVKIIDSADIYCVGWSETFTINEN